MRRNPGDIFTMKVQLRSIISQFSHKYTPPKRSPLTEDVGCPLWVLHLTCALPLLRSCYGWYHVMLHHAITGPNWAKLALCAENPSIRLIFAQRVSNAGFWWAFFVVGCTDRWTKRILDCENRCLVYTFNTMSLRKSLLTLNIFITTFCVSKGVECNIFIEQYILQCCQ